jgi:hypothetical protein
MKNLNLWAALISTLVAGLAAVETGLRKGEGGWLLLLAFSVQGLITLKAAITPAPSSAAITVEMILAALRADPLLQAALVSALTPGPVGEEATSEKGDEDAV